MQNIATVSKKASSIHGHVPSDLLHPLLVQVEGDARDGDLAAIKMNKEQHGVGHQSSDVRTSTVKKVGRCWHREVDANEFCPGRVAVLRSRWNIVTAQHIADGLIGDLIS